MHYGYAGGHGYAVLKFSRKSGLQELKTLQVGKTLMEGFANPPRLAQTQITKLQALKLVADPTPISPFSMLANTFRSFFAS